MPGQFQTRGLPDLQAAQANGEMLLRAAIARGQLESDAANREARMRMQEADQQHELARMHQAYRLDSQRDARRAQLDNAQADRELGRRLYMEDYRARKEIEVNDLNEFGLSPENLQAEASDLYPTLHPEVARQKYRDKLRAAKSRRDVQQQIDLSREFEDQADARYFDQLEEARQWVTGGGAVAEEDRQYFIDQINQAEIERRLGIAQRAQRQGGRRSTPAPPSNDPEWETVHDPDRGTIQRNRYTGMERSAAVGPDAKGRPSSSAGGGGGRGRSTGIDTRSNESIATSVLPATQDDWQKIEEAASKITIPKLDRTTGQMIEEPLSPLHPQWAQTIEALIDQRAEVARNIVAKNRQRDAEAQTAMEEATRARQLEAQRAQRYTDALGLTEPGEAPVNVPEGLWNTPEGLMHLPPTDAAPQSARPAATPQNGNKFVLETDEEAVGWHLNQYLDRMQKLKAAGMSLADYAKSDPDGFKQLMILRDGSGLSGDEVKITLKPKPVEKAKDGRPILDTDEDAINWHIDQYRQRLQDLSALGISPQQYAKEDPEGYAELMRFRDGAGLNPDIVMRVKKKDKSAEAARRFKAMME